MEILNPKLQKQRCSLEGNQRSTDIAQKKRKTSELENRAIEIIQIEAEGRKKGGKQSLSQPWEKNQGI